MHGSGGGVQPPHALTRLKYQFSGGGFQPPDLFRQPKA
jgi:hypothetical protein